MKTVNRTGAFLPVAAFAGAMCVHPFGVAGIVAFDQPALSPGWESDLSLVPIGDSVDTVTFSSLLENDLLASVSTDSALNQITPELWWRLRGGTTVLSFDAELSSFWTEYQHQRNAAVHLVFEASDGTTVGTAVIDGRAGTSGSVGFVADEGESFSSVSVVWVRADGQWMELGPTISVERANGVPSPGMLTLTGVCGALFFRRKNTRV